MKWKMVPVEPTPEMLEAAWDWHGNGNWSVADDKFFPGFHKAMLEAAPKYEPTDEQVEAGARALGEDMPIVYNTVTHAGMKSMARAVLMTLEG